MTQRIILFNGPPRCGKDTAARYVFDTGRLRESHFIVFDRMSMPIKRAFAAMMGASIDMFGNISNWETNKEKHNELLDCSYRQWQIDFSEKFMKPLYGENIFSRLFVHRIQMRQHKDAVVLVPDCGFDIEYTTFVNAFGKENILVVKVYRPGCDFKNDSRNYLKVGSFGTKLDSEPVIHINNDSTQESFEAKVLSRVTIWLERTTDAS